MKKVFLIVLSLISSIKPYSQHDFVAEQAERAATTSVDVIKINDSTNVQETIATIKKSVRDCVPLIVLDIVVDNWSPSFKQYCDLYEDLKFLATKSHLIAFISGNALAGSYLLASLAHTIVAKTFSKIEVIDPKISPEDPLNQIYKHEVFMNRKLKNTQNLTNINRPIFPKEAISLGLIDEIGNEDSIEKIALKIAQDQNSEKRYISFNHGKENSPYYPEN